MSQATETTGGTAAATRLRPRAKKSATKSRASRRQDLADVVRKAVDEGATTVEDIHKAVADLPLEMIARLDGFEDALKDVRRVQKESIGAIYDLIRRINRDVTRLAGEMLRARGRRLRGRSGASAKRPARAKRPGSAAARA
jgi:hypothetical protein